MWTPKDEYTREAHLAQMTAVLGSMPKRLLDRFKNRDRYFNAGGIDILPAVLDTDAALCWTITNLYRQSS